ncbi:dolichyl-diphosphooligosaccharide--protein glycosyltransferase subunit 2-like protein [Tanacetum coccineum]
MQGIVAVKRTTFYRERAAGIILLYLMHYLSSLFVDVRYYYLQLGINVESEQFNLANRLLVLFCLLIGRTNVSVHITRVVKVDNAKVALLDEDSVESEKKLDLPGKNDVALSANHLQKLNLGVIGSIIPSLEKLEILIIYDVET